jgi:hypothetical protein
MKKLYFKKLDVQEENLKKQKLLLLLIRLQLVQMVLKISLVHSFSFAKTLKLQASLNSLV